MTDLDRYFDDFGRQLRAAHPPPRRRGLALGAALAVAAAVVLAAIVLIPGGGARPVDAIAAAREALSPAGQIVYMRVRLGREGMQSPGSTTDQWWSNEPRRWRLSQSVESGRVWDSDLGEVTGHYELSYGDGVVSRFASGSNRLLEISGYADDAPQTALPTLIGISGDPDLDLRAMLATGKVRDVGDVQVGGRTVRRLVAEHADGSPRTLTYDVDPTTFAPLSVRIEFKPNAQREAAPVLVMTVERYERIPLTDESAKLLTIQTTADTDVIRRTADEQTEREQETLRCIKSKPRQAWTCPGVPRPAGAGTSKKASTKVWSVHG